MLPLTQLASQVWVLPPDPDPAQVQPSVGVICTATQTLLVDAGNGDRHARQVAEALRSIDAPPVRFVIYTHHHWDHVFGAQQVAEALRSIDAPPVRFVIYTHHHWDHVFGAQQFDAAIIAHEQTRELLRGRASEPWGQAYLAEAVAHEPRLAASYGALGRAIESWDTFAVRVPTITFSQRLRLHLDGLCIELEHVGGQHAPDSIVVRVPEAGVLFLGDCFYPPPLHERGPDAKVDRAMLARFAADEAVSVYVQGHGPAASEAWLRTFLDGASKE